MNAEKAYVPAAGHDVFLPFYDPMQWLLGGPALRSRVIEGADLRAHQRVLDVGCGTGSLVVALAAGGLELRVTGLDPDPKALARAAAKLEREGADVRLDEGFADALPYADASFDRVFSTFMFHHLDRETKTGSVAEIRRVLAPGGALHLLDFAQSAERGSGWLARLLHAEHDLADNRDDRILALCADALAQGRVVFERQTIFGRVAHFAATRS